LPLLAIKGKEGKVQQAAFIDNHKDVFDQLDKVNKASVAKRLKIIPKYDTFAKETVNLFTKYIELQDKLSEEKDKLKALLTKIYEKVRSKYDELSEDDIRHLVVDCKWRGTIMARADSLLSEVNQKMTTDLIALRDRYAHTLPSIETRVNDLRSKVNESLAAMGIKL
jgi:type I restriction enzyme M protein